MAGVVVGNGNFPADRHRLVAPEGRTLLEAGDRAQVFCQPDDRELVELPFAPPVEA